MAALILLLGCGRPPGLEGCEREGDPIAREDCRYDAVKVLLDDRAAFAAAVDRITPETSRDLVLIRLSVDHPEKAQELCRMVRTAAAQDKCQKVIGRPHLGGVPR
jgi:hypothetical protein